MNRHRTRTLLTLLWPLACATTLLAQDTEPKAVVLPNAMTPHTWFMIAVLAAFLTWSVSYSLQLQKEGRKRRASREGSPEEKNHIIRQIVELQAQREAGKISELRYDQSLRKLKSRLSRILEQSRQKRSTPAGS